MTDVRVTKVIELSELDPTPAVSVTKVIELSELDPIPGVSVTKVLELVELDPQVGEVFLTQAGVLVELDPAGGVFLTQAGVLVELDYVPPENIKTTQFGALVELESSNLFTTQFGALVELESSNLFVSQFGALIELDPPPPEEVRATQLGTFAELSGAGALVTQSGALAEVSGLGMFTTQVGVFAELSPVLASAYLVELYADASNYIKVYFSGVDEITLAFNDGDVEHSDTWDVTGLILQDILYQFVITYDSSGITLSVDGDAKITINEPVNFALVPTTAYWGQDNTNNNVASATFSEPI